MTVSDFPSFMEIENMHTLIQLLLEDCGISFLYRIAANEGLAVGQLREIRLTDFFMRHDFDFIWDKNSIFAGETEKLAEELAL
jgi:DNA-binding transcriptional LysR family regulator